MKHAWLPIFMAFAAFAQVPERPPGQFPADAPRPEMRRQQRDAISKQDYKDNLKDAAELVKLSQDLQMSFEHSGSFVVDANDIRAAERIEKLARNIHGRLKRF